MLKQIIISLVGISCLFIISIGIYGIYYLLRNTILLGVSHDIVLTVCSVAITTLIILSVLLIWGIYLNIKSTYKEDHHANTETD